LIPYLNRVPSPPVRSWHVAWAVCLPLVLVAGCYFFGDVPTMRLLMGGMVLCTLWVAVFFPYHAVRALRRKELVGFYGRVSFVERPALFSLLVAYLIAIGVLGPIALIALTLHEARRLGIRLPL
jgi:hypothetical protein